MFAAAALATVGVLTVGAQAFGADASWIKPVEEGAKELTTSLVAIAGAVVGLCLVGYAAWGAITGQFQTQKIIVILFAATIIGVGPALATWFIGKFSGS